MKIFSFLEKIEIGISIIPFLVIVLLSGYYKLFFTYFLITLIHELGHVIVAKIFKVKINNIKLTVFGFNADIEDYKYLNIYKQLLILIAGPLTYFISIFLLQKLYVWEVISLVTYYKALLTNKYIFIFNLLPIFPLDGGRIIKIILDRIFTYKTSKIISNIVSTIFLTLFIVYTGDHKQYLMYVFLVINLVLNVLFLDKEWKKFLVSRLYFDNKYPSKIHYKKDLYVYKDNYLIKNKELLSEKEGVVELLKD